VAAPDGFTVPLSVAVEEPTADASPVVTDGAERVVVDEDEPDPPVVDVVVVGVVAGAGVVVVAVVVVAPVVVVGPADPVVPVGTVASTPFRLPAWDGALVPAVDPFAVDSVELETEPLEVAVEACDDEPTTGEPDDVEPDDVEPDGGQLRARSFASCALAAASADLSVLSCWRAVVNWDWDCWRLTSFEAFCASVSPALAVASVLWAWARFAWAEASVACAVDGSTFASTSPAVTRSPTATSTSLNVPLVPKSAADELATLTFPEAVTLDCTVPRATVAVRWIPAFDVELSRNP